MSTIKVLNSINKFLLEKVAPQIKLQQATDNDIDDYSLVNPKSFVGWIPPKGYLPEGMETAIPCYVVGMDDAADDSQSTSMKIRVTAVVFSPGTNNPDLTFVPDFKGYHDLLNLIDIAKAELRKNIVVGESVVIEDEIKWGMYEELAYPYWYGWLTFNVRSLAYPASEIAKKYL